MREEEKERLELESFEDTSFLSQFERILLAIEHSANSDLGARIAGHFAAIRKMPVTVLDIVDDNRVNTSLRPGTAPQPDGGARKIGEQVKAASDEAVEAQTKERGPTIGDEVHIAVRANYGELRDILSETSEKTHDMMFAGVEPTSGESGGYSDQLTTMIDAFSATTAIISARGHLPEPDSHILILLPVRGTERSIKAAEFAFVIAKKPEVPAISAVYFRDTAQAGSSRR